MTTEAAAAAPAPLTDEQLVASFPGQDIEHIKSMMGKADGAGAVISPNADGVDEALTAELPAINPDTVYPDYIPAKYRNGTVEEAHAAMAKGYNELEGKLGGTQTGKESSITAASADAGATNEADPAADAGEAGPLSLTEVEASYVANDSTISEEIYAQYEEQGMPRATLDAYISGQQAIASQMVTSVHAEVGGPDQYKALTEWADANWTDDEVVAFDKIVTSGDKASAVVATRGLRAAYESAMGQDPQLVTGETGQGPKGAIYESRAQMTADMKDPRYKTDPAFRATVATKVGNSNIW